MYGVYRWDSVSRQYALVDTLAANSTRHRVRGLARGVTYQFCVVAFKESLWETSGWKEITF
jgi:hypothetical protein